MPWIKDENSEDVYEPSVYTKEDLPTWGELYCEFLMNYGYTYIAAKDTEIDPYWKLPRKLVVLAQSCNQLNKMLFEDNLRNFFKVSRNANDVRFLLCSSKEIFTGDKSLIGTEKISPIYTLPFPNGKENPFAIADVDRIDVSTLEGDIYLVYVIDYAGERTDYYYGPDNIFQDDLRMLCKEVFKYFEGERPGWKDENGKVINTGETGRCNSGIDPAL